MPFFCHPGAARYARNLWIRQLIATYRKLFTLFDAVERRRFWILTGVMVLVAATEIIGMSAVLMLLNVLSAPDMVQSHPILSRAYQALGFESTFSFQVALASAVMVVVVGGLAVKAFGVYATTRFSMMRGYTVSTRLLSAYLSQPYTWFLNRNSAELGKNVLIEVDGLVARVFQPCLRLVANALLVTAILAFLLLVDPLVTLFSGGVLGLGYALIYLRFRVRLQKLGEDMIDSYEARYVVAQEATGGIKDVKLLGLEATYVKTFGTASYKTAQSASTVGVLQELPRYLLEAMTFGTLLALILILLVQSGGNITDIVPTLGVIAFSTMRLLPALQQIYHGLAALRSASTILDTIVADIKATPPLPITDPSNTPPMTLESELELSKVSFTYDQSEKPILRAVDLVIPARTTVGIVGGTGAGKTTLVDLILGLLTPKEGVIKVDGVQVTEENRRAWQKTLGYVPQSIFLTDDTIAANIAFGVPKDEIDMAAVERVAKTAALHDFVISDLPEAYQTMVGERGVRLSGGQRQRIGIARALYRNPALLIMDEATSALDNITERVVMEAVQNIRSDKTVILIAHRLSTVKTCDTIFLMERGRVMAQGSYDELLAGNETFRRMVSGGIEDVHAAQ
jgi:ABC-type multidrug transport system fused ATPase/permease subunit